MKNDFSNEEKIKQFLKELNSPSQKFEKLKTYTNAANSPLFETELEEKYKINILPDKNIRRGIFLPTLNPKEYKAHPVTIRAMKKDIFVGGNDFVDLECLVTCPSCKSEIDLQFWQFCPFCECTFT
jgi:hypothetical protein